MPLYGKHYTPGQLQFITTGTYRRGQIFLSDRFRDCFVAGSARVPTIFVGMYGTTGVECGRVYAQALLRCQPPPLCDRKGEGQTRAL